jgi:hypothetical protein
MDGLRPMTLMTLPPVITITRVRANGDKGKRRHMRHRMLAALPRDGASWHAVRLFGQSGGSSTVLISERV